MSSRIAPRGLLGAQVPLSMAAAGVTGRSTVVIVDDQPANVALLERLLLAAGVKRVHGFTDPRQALAHCAASLPDLVLLDLHMPVLDGFAVMDALDDLVPDGGFLPVLVLTADVSAEVRERHQGNRRRPGPPLPRRRPRHLRRRDPGHDHRRGHRDRE